MRGEASIDGRITMQAAPQRHDVDPESSHIRDQIGLCPPLEIKGRARCADSDPRHLLFDTLDRACRFATPPDLRVFTSHGRRMQ